MHAQGEERTEGGHRTGPEWGGGRTRAVQAMKAQSVNISGDGDQRGRDSSNTVNKHRSTRLSFLFIPPQPGDVLRHTSQLFLAPVENKAIHSKKTFDYRCLKCIFDLICTFITGFFYDVYAVTLPTVYPSHVFFCLSSSQNLCCIHSPCSSTKAASAALVSLPAHHSSFPLLTSPLLQH